MDIPRCSIPGADLDRCSGGHDLKQCALNRWCDTEGQRTIGHTREFQQLRHIHARLHVLAQQIARFDHTVSHAQWMYAVNYFKDLWQELLIRVKGLSQDPR